MKQQFDNRALQAPTSRSYHPYFTDVCIVKGQTIDPSVMHNATRKYLSQAQLKRMQLKLAIAKGARILPVI